MTFIIANAAVIGMSLAAVGTVASVHGQLTAGKQAEADAKQAAENERLAAESAELQRQQKLNKALAANAVGLAASGIKAEGTPASIALESAKNIGLSEGMINLSSRLKQAQMIRAGQNARSAANIGAAGTLLSGAGQLGMAYGSYNKAAPTTIEATGTYSSDWNYNG